MNLLPRALSRRRTRKVAWRGVRGCSVRCWCPLPVAPELRQRGLDERIVDEGVEVRRLADETLGDVPVEVLVHARAVEVAIGVHTDMAHLRVQARVTDGQVLRADRRELLDVAPLVDHLVVVA